MLDDLLVVSEPPALVNLDIEGHELPAFRGATELLTRVRPIWLVEFHGQGLPARDVDSDTRSYVASFGYK